jgi:hypothetical protein
MPLRTERLDRIIHFYQLVFSFDTDAPQHQYRKIVDVFRDIKKITSERDGRRYQPMNDKFLFINDIDFDTTNKYIKGKLLSVRQDLMPQLIGMSDDEVSDIAARDDQGIVETNHFIIYYGGRKVYIAFEYNRSGAFIQEMTYYIKAVPKQTVELQELDYLPIVRDDINEIKRRMNAISSLTVQLHKSNEEVLREFPEGTASAMRTLLNIENIDYANVDLKFKVDRAQGTPEGESPESIIGKLIEGIQRGRIRKNNIDKILVVARDEDNGNKMALFDLLFDKVKSKISVDRNPKSRTIVSNQMFEKMWQELNRQRLVQNN